MANVSDSDLCGYWVQITHGSNLSEGFVIFPLLISKELLWESPVSYLLENKKRKRKGNP